MSIAFNDTTVGQGDVVTGFASAYSLNGLRRLVGLHSVQGKKQRNNYERSKKRFRGETDIGLPQ